MEVVTIAGTGEEAWRDGPAIKAQMPKPSRFVVNEDYSLLFTDYCADRIGLLSADHTTITTVAGDGVDGWRDGPALDARFKGPNGMARDRVGNIAIADTCNGRIRLLSSDLTTVTTIAGDGCRRHRDGPAAVASFTFPRGVIFTNDGSMLVADGHCIRKLDENRKNITTVAGSSDPGLRDGPATEARFNYVRDIAKDAAGDFLITDFNNHRIRKLSSDLSTVTTVVGTSRGHRDGSVAAARLNHPTNLAIDGKGDIYISGWDSIRKLSADKKLVSTISGEDQCGFQDGDTKTAKFNFPDGIMISLEGDLVIADAGNHRIRLLTGINAEPPLLEALPVSPAAVPPDDLPPTSTSLLLERESRLEILSTWIDEAKRVCTANHQRAVRIEKDLSMSRNAKISQEEALHVARVRRSELERRAGEARAVLKYNESVAMLELEKIKRQQIEIAQAEAVYASELKTCEISQRKRQKDLNEYGNECSKSKIVVLESRDSPKSILIRPREHMCPLTMDLMQDPVVAADGCTYERKAIEEWLRDHCTSPLHNTILPTKLVFRNLTLKEQITQWNSNQSDSSTSSTTM